MKNIIKKIITKIRIFFRKEKKNEPSEIQSIFDVIWRFWNSFRGYFTINLDAMNEDGELLEDDVLYILDGILQDVIRHKFKAAIESIKETIERKELCD